MITVRFGKKEIEWAIMLLKRRYGKQSPRLLVECAIKEIVRDEANKMSIEVSTPTPKQKRARTSQDAASQAR